MTDIDYRPHLVEALRTIEELQARLAEPQAAEPIAVIGMGCRLPGGVTEPDEFWHLLRNGVDATGEFPAERADAAAYFDPDPNAPGKAHTMRGGFLGRIDRFEPAVFGISPREAVGMDPQHRLTLEVTWEALERAGYAPDRLEGTRTGVYLGVSTTDYVRLRQQVGDPADIDAYQLVGEPSFLAGRVSYTLGLRGPSQVIDTACSSSLVAVHEACQALRSGECDLALAGGVNLMLAPYGFVLMSKFGALAPDGRCKTFDASADGYARGEGAGVIVLKRASEALADGDTILAFVNGSAINHDGRSSGMTVPNPVAQRDVVERALAQARIAPDRVDYVEAHGTGTSLGDPIELRALHDVLAAERADGDPLLVGSAKTNIGHLESAAGIAGLIKIVLAMRHGEIPPHLHFTQPNPNIDWGRLNVRVTASHQDWPSRGEQRVAAVSSFGVSGTNAHAVLSSGPVPVAERGAAVEPAPETVFLHARSGQALTELADRFARHLRREPGLALRDVAFTSQVGRTRQPEGLAVVADSVDGVAEALAAYARGGRDTRIVEAGLPAHKHRKTAWLFTGQGSQYAGMAAGLRAEPAFQAAFDEVAALLDEGLDRPLREVVWPTAGTPTPLDDTRYTQPALFAIEYALSALWRSWGLKPAAVAGHSIGEITAAVVAGVLSLPDAARLVVARARLMSALPAGGVMLAVRCDEQTACGFIAPYPDTVSLAAVNSPNDVVVAGAADDVAAVQQAMAAEGIAGTLLTVSHAFHSPLMRPMVDEFRRVLDGLTFHAPRLPIVSNVTGTWWTPADAGPQYWIDHALGAVRFLDGVRTLHADGFRTFLEIGPQPVLSTLGARCVDDDQSVFTASLRRGGDRQQLPRALATLHLRGAALDWSAVHAGRDVRRVALPTTPWHGESYWFREAAPVAAASGPVGETVLTEPVPVLRVPGAHPVYQLRPPTGGEEVALPVGTLAGLALDLAKDGYGRRCTVVEELVVHGRLGAAELARGAQVTLSQVDEAGVRCAVHAADPAGESAGAPWRLLAEAVVRTRPTAEQHMAIEADRLVTHDFDAAAAVNARRVLDCDVVAHVRREGDGVLFALDPAADITAARVVDATLAAVHWAAGRTEAAAPVDGTRLGGLVCADPSRVRYVYATGRRDAAGAVTGSVRLYAEGGACIGGAAAVAVPAPPPAGLVRTAWQDPASLLYDLAWQPLPPGTLAPAPVAGSGHLLLATELAFADQLAEELRARGAQATVAAPPVRGTGADCVPDLDALRELVAAWAATTAAPSRIVLLTGLTAPRLTHTDARGLHEHLAVADLLVTALVQVLGDTLPGVRLVVVTRGAAATGFEGPDVDAVSQTLWGLGRVVALEHPERWAGAIDLDPHDRRGECGRLIEALGRTAAEDQQAVRGTNALVARLVSRPLHPDEAAREPAVRADGSYLITGGFGGIGREIAIWLAVAGAGRIVLAARSPLPAREAWDGELSESDRARVDLVRRLERLGAQVSTAAVDVVDDSGMARLFTELAEDRLPLRGIVHAAGVSGPAFVRDVTPAEYRAVWAPKVVGGALLHQLSGASTELELFLSFSSVAATWGSQHLASYSAGNAFLDGLAFLRKGQGLPALTVAWGPWDLPSALFDAEVMAFLHATGLRSLDAAQSLRLLGPLLASDRPTAVVCAADWSVYKPVMEARTDRPVLRTVHVDDDEATGGERGTYADLVALAGAPDAAAAARELITPLLADVLAGVLGGASIGPDDDIVRCGLDSLMAMEVVRALKRELRVSVKASALFEHPTVTDWAVLVRDEFARAHWGDAAPAGEDTAGRVDQTDPAWIDGDVRLDPAIMPQGPVSVAEQPRHLLLTGATGFIGAYLLDELLARTDATVHALVRCDDPAEGLARVRANVEHYLPWRPDADARVVIVPGDLAEPLLGLGAERFAALAADCDGVFHAGAWVHFSYTYDQLRAANLTGTEELLRLAVHGGRTIPVHHVSTYGIWGVPAEGRHAIAEDEPISTAGRLVTGYVQTKWAAERLVEQARERGLPVDVHRLGRVLGDSRTGACLTTHFTTRVIKGCVQLGLAPDIDIDIEMTPVDYTARALVAIALGKQSFGDTYHLINPVKMRFLDLIRIIREHGWPVEVVPVERWWSVLRDSYGNRPNELHAVMGVVEEFVVGGEEAIDYGTAHADAALAGTGISCPPLDAGLLHTYLGWLRDSGYLPAPEPAPQSTPPTRSRSRRSR